MMMSGVKIYDKYFMIVDCRLQIADCLPAMIGYEIFANVTEFGPIGLALMTSIFLDKDSRDDKKGEDVSQWTTIE